MATFLALQCYRCNVMQVKHDKKSSNKWSCSVCNEKQSVRKVFATSCAAKDIRKFVQDYNLMRNITQDRALAELVQRTEAGGNTGFPSFNISCDEFNQPHLKTENKWTEYLSPENKASYAETSEGTSDDAKFVTTILGKPGRKPKRRVHATVEEQVEQFPLQQQPGLSCTRGRIGKLSNKSTKSFTECHDDMQKENDLPHVWARKTSSASLLQARKNASIQCRKQLVGSEMADVSVHRRIVTDTNGERVLVQANLENKTNMASKIPEFPGGMKEKPASKWETYLDLTKHVGDGSTCAIAEQEKHVSKWAEYLDFDEVKPRVEAMQNSGPMEKGGKFQHASKEAFGKPGQSQESLTSIWSFKAVNNFQCSNSVSKTELDELFNASWMSEEMEDEVHPLFL